MIKMKTRIHSTKGSVLKTVLGGFHWAGVESKQVMKWSKIPGLEGHFQCPGGEGREHPKGSAPEAQRGAEYQKMSSVTLKTLKFTLSILKGHRNIWTREWKALTYAFKDHADSCWERTVGELNLKRPVMGPRQLFRFNRAVEQAGEEVVRGACLILFELRKEGDRTGYWIEDGV